MTTRWLINLVYRAIRGGNRGRRASNRPPALLAVEASDTSQRYRAALSKLREVTADLHITPIETPIPVLSARESLVEIEASLHKQDTAMRDALAISPRKTSL